MADSATSSHSAPPQLHSHDPGAIAMIQLASAASEQYGKGLPDRSRDATSFAEADAAFAGSSAYPATAPNMNGAPGVVPGGGAPLPQHHPINENDMNNVVQVSRSAYRTGSAQERPPRAGGPGTNSASRDNLLKS